MSSIVDLLNRSRYGREHTSLETTSRRILAENVRCAGIKALKTIGQHCGTALRHGISPCTIGFSILAPASRDFSDCCSHVYGYEDLIHWSCGYVSKASSENVGQPHGRPNSRKLGYDGDVERFVHRDRYPSRKDHFRESVLAIAQTGEGSKTNANTVHRMRMQKRYSTLPFESEEER